MKPLRLHRDTIVAIRLAEAVGLDIGGFPAEGSGEKRAGSIARAVRGRTLDGVRPGSRARASIARQVDSGRLAFARGDLAQPRYSSPRRPRTFSLPPSR